MGGKKGGKNSNVHPSAPPVELYAAPSFAQPHHPSFGAPPFHRPPLPFGYAGPSHQVHIRDLPAYPSDYNQIHFVSHPAQQREEIYEDLSEDEVEETSLGCANKVDPSKVARFNPKTMNLRKTHKRRKANPMYYTKRGCTDIACCFLFLLFVAGWAVVAIIGFMWGNPERLIHPTDSLGRRCGTIRKGAYNMSEKPYLFFFDLTKCISYATVLAGCQTPQICVSECPSTYFSYLQLQTDSSSIFNQKVQSNVICADEVDKKSITRFSDLKNLINQKKCAAYTVKSAPMLGRCVPQALIGAAQTLNDLQKSNGTLDLLIQQYGDDGGNVPNDQTITNSSHAFGDIVESEGIVTKIAADLSKSWWHILMLIAAAGVFSFIWTVVMRILGSFMIWSSILLILAGLSSACGYCWIRWKKLTDLGAIDDYSFQPMFNLYFEMPTTWMVFAIIASVLLVIVVLILLCVGNRIRLGVAMIEESSKAIGNMMSTLIFPLFPFMLHIVVFAIWGSIAIWLASSGEDNCRKVGTSVNQTMVNPKCDCNTIDIDTSCVFVNVTRDNDKIFYFQAYNLFAFFWMSCFVSALGDIALAGAFASHYWARDKNRDLPSFPVIRSLWFAVKFNMGSLAFGSLIIALVKFIRVILDYLDKQATTTRSTIVKYIISVFKCCFWCMEVFLKFLTKNAYIMMAIYGKSFFSSAKDSFLLLTRNCIRVVVINKVSGFLLFIGKATITIGMGVIAFFWFSGRWIIDGIPQVDLYFYFVPIIVVLIGSYFIADMFFDVYEMAVDTTFICFLEDSEQNDGSPEKPFFMSPSLFKILGKKTEMAMAVASKK